MKKLVKIAIGLVVLLVVALVVVYFMLGGIIKKGVETVGPELTQGDVKLEEASLSITGSGGIKGLVIGNPKNADFKSPFAFKVGSLDVKVQIASITSDKIIVEEIIIDGAELCWDGLKGNNHMKILENIEAFIGGGEEPKEGEESSEEPQKEKAPGKKVVIKLFKLTNTTVHVYVMGQKLPSLPLPDVTKENIGEDSGGASMGDAVKEVYASIYSGVTDLVADSGDLIKDALGGLKDLSGDAAKGLQDAGKGAVNSVKAAGKSIKDGLKNLNPFK